MTAVQLAALVVGGATGTVCRHLVAITYHGNRPWNPATFPWHTFVINAVGSFVFGLIAVACKDRPDWRLLLGTGFCGGFTTFSAFSYEAVKLMERDHGEAALYAVGSVAAGVAGALVGIKIGG